MALSALRESLDEIRTDPDAEGLATLRERLADAQRAYGVVQRRMERHAPAATMTRLDDRMAALWSEVETGLREPGSRRARMDAARQIVDEALEQPSRVSGPTFRMVHPASVAGAR